MKNLTVRQAFEKQFPNVWLGSDFKNWFGDMPFNEKANVTKLTSRKLSRGMNDFEIQKELNPGEISIEELYATLKTLDHSVWLLAYCKDRDGVLRTVHVYWHDGGWHAGAYALDGSRWDDGRRVFSRNSCLEPKAPESSDALEPATLDPSLEPLASLPSILEINGVKYKKI